MTIHCLHKKQSLQEFKLQYTIKLAWLHLLVYVVLLPVLYRLGLLKRDVDLPRTGSVEEMRAENDKDTLSSMILLHGQLFFQNHSINTVYKKRIGSRNKILKLLYIG